MRIAALLLLLAPLSASAAGNFAGKPVVRAGTPIVLGSLRLSSLNLAGAKALVSLGIVPTVTVKLTPVQIETLSAATPAELAKLLSSSLKTPEAAVAAAIAQAPVLEALKASAAREAAQNAPGKASFAGAWQGGAQSFDGAGGGASFVDPYSGAFRRVYGSEAAKVQATIQYASQGSRTFAALNDEFQQKGGYYMLDNNYRADYLAKAAVDNAGRPVIILTHDLLNRDNQNGKWGDEFKGAPWEFIASVIAREQVFSNSWYASIPASAEKLTLAFMNMARVFVELTNGTTRSWATDKDYKETAHAPQNKVILWPWFEQMVNAARAAARGVGTNSGHLIESTILGWARDWVAPNQKAGVPGFAYSLWELLDGKYFRPGKPENGQPLPANAPRIDQATYDRASYTAYGADGKGSNQHNALDANTVFGWIIQWLRGRGEI